MVRMLKHRQQQMTLQNTAITSPPKPPSWRDFTVTMKTRSPIQSQTKLHKGSKSLDFTDLAKLQSQVLCKQGCSNCEDKKVVNTINNKIKRSKAKIHRTQSEKCISEEEIPREHLAMNLADTKPQDIGLRQKNYLDERLYLVDNTLRCRKWLSEIEPIDPGPDPTFSQGQGEVIEIPEETWQDFATDNTREPQNSQTNVAPRNLPAKTVSFNEPDCMVLASQNIQVKEFKGKIECNDEKSTGENEDTIGCCRNATGNTNDEESHVNSNCKNNSNLLSATLSKQGQLISRFHEEGASSHSLCVVETPVTDYLNKCP